MEMKIDIDKILFERNKRAWTQGQLADICDLSLRTVQRIEKTGVASNASIQAIASAYNLTVENLIYKEKKHKNKRVEKVDFGKSFAVIGLVFLLVLPLILFITLVTGTHLILDVTQAGGPKTTVSSTFTLLLLFKYTKITYFTLLPGIISLLISKVLYNTKKPWVTKSIIIASLFFLFSSPKFGIFLIGVISILILTQNRNQSKQLF